MAKIKRAFQPIPEGGESGRDGINPSLERVWVLNQEVHLDEEGHEVHSSPYIWLRHQCSGKSTSFVAGEVHPGCKGAEEDCYGMPCRPYVRAYGDEKDSGKDQGVIQLEGGLKGC